MSDNIIHFMPAQEEQQRFELRQQQAERLTIALTQNHTVEVNGVQHSLENVVDNLIADQEQREKLSVHLINLLLASLDEEPAVVSRINRMVIAGAKELAFQLSADLSGRQPSMRKV